MTKENKLDIVILADFLGSLDRKSNSRFLYLADMLVKNHDVEVITSDFNHGGKKHFDYEIEKHDYPITMLHEEGYPKNVCLKRFYAHYIWGKSVKDYLNKRKKPDVIYCAVPPLSASYEAALYCEKNNIRFIVDIQDLWPEAFKMVFHIPIVSSVIFAPFNYLANGIYKRADAICAVSDTYSNRALTVNRKSCEAITVFLGTDLSVFDKNAKEHPIMEKSQDEIWIAYCGTLGASYDLTVVIKALHLVDDNRVKFIVMGDGPRKEEFKAYADKLGVPAVFTGKLEYKAMCSLLVICDIAVNPIMHMAAQSIINKHADYASAGIPVLNTQENREYRQLVESYKMGFNCENGNDEQLAEKIKLLVNDINLRYTMGNNARKCAEELFDRSVSYKRLVDTINGAKHG